MSGRIKVVSDGTTVGTEVTFDGRLVLGVELVHWVLPVSGPGARPLVTLELSDAEVVIRHRSRDRDDEDSPSVAGRS